MMLCAAANTTWSFDDDNTLLIFWSRSEWLRKQIRTFSASSEVKLKTYMTGNTLGNTTEPSAKYWYKTLVSASSVEYFTSVASTVKTSACVELSGSTSGSRRTFDSFDTDDRDPRSFNFFTRDEKLTHEYVNNLNSYSLKVLLNQLVC